MKAVLIVMAVATVAMAAEINLAEKVALSILGVNSVVLEDESENSYFFVTEIEYEADDIDEDYPCIRGVLIDKVDNQPLDPRSDPMIQVEFDYSLTVIDGFVVKNCAD